jgi:histidinol-phosphatase (PHP family)
MSDDSHGVSQVGTNYQRSLAFIKKAGIKDIWYADRKAGKTSDARFSTGFSKVSVGELEQHPFWAAT